MQLTLIHYIWWAVFGLRQTFLCILTKQFCPRFACLHHIIPRRLVRTCMFTGQPWFCSNVLFGQLFNFFLERLSRTSDFKIFWLYIQALASQQLQNKPANHGIKFSSIPWWLLFCIRQSAFAVAAVPTHGNSYYFTKKCNKFNKWGKT